MKKVLLIADQYLDPRLRRRAKWFKKSGYEVYISYFSRAEWFRNKAEEDYKFIEYKSKEILLFENTVVYVAGARAIVDNFFNIMRIKNRNTIIVEIPDLPLRSKYKIINAMTTFLFNKILNMATNNIVVTSDYFIKKLPKKKNYLFLENIIGYTYAKNLYNIESKKDNKNIIKIGYIGIVRYLDQIKMMIDYAISNKNIEFHIYGGPLERLDSLNINFDIYDNIFMHGNYVFEDDIINIYRSVDIVYSVYDANQPNVKIALPNKLYEAILAKKWFLVADDTYLSTLVNDKKIGISLPYENDKYIVFEKKLSTFINKIQDRKIEFNNKEASRVLEQSLQQHEIFIDFIEGCK